MLKNNELTLIAYACPADVLISSHRLEELEGKENGYLTRDETVEKNLLKKLVDAIKPINHKIAQQQANLQNYLKALYHDNSALLDDEWRIVIQNIVPPDQVNQYIEPKWYLPSIIKIASQYNGEIVDRYSDLNYKRFKSLYMNPSERGEFTALKTLIDINNTIEKNIGSRNKHKDTHQRQTR